MADSKYNESNHYGLSEEQYNEVMAKVKAVQEKAKANGITLDTWYDRPGKNNAAATVVQTHTPPVKTQTPKSSDKMLSDLAARIERYEREETAHEVREDKRESVKTSYKEPAKTPYKTSENTYKASTESTPILMALGISLVMPIVVYFRAMLLAFHNIISWKIIDGIVALFGHSAPEIRCSSYFGGKKWFSPYGAPFTFTILLISLVFGELWAYAGNRALALNGEEAFVGVFMLYAFSFIPEALLMCINVVTDKIQEIFCD